MIMSKGGFFIKDIKTSFMHFVMILSRFCPAISDLKS